MFTQEQQQLFDCSTLSQCKLLLVLQATGGASFNSLLQATGMTKATLETNLSLLEDWSYVCVYWSDEMVHYLKFDLDAALTSNTSTTSNKLTSTSKEKKQEKATSIDVAKKKQKKKVATFDELLKLHPHLDTAEFRTTWGRWKDHRKNTMRKPLKPTTVRSQLTQLAKFTSGEAIEAIERSMDLEWIGLFPKRVTTRSKDKPAATVNADGVIVAPTAARKQNW